MSTILPFTSESALREAAGIWIARIDRGLTAAEHVDLQSWLRRSPRHQSMLLEMAALWDRTDILSEMAALFPLERRSQKPAWLKQLPALAAVVVTAVVIVTSALWPRGTTVHPFEVSFQTQLGQQRRVALPDQSIVTLNTATRLAVDYTATARVIDLLGGEAHFKVAKEANRSFTVKVGTLQFTAIGTEFNVRVISASDVQLTVTEGRVGVIGTPVQKGPHGPPILVDAGRKWDSDSNLSVEALTPLKIDAAVAWTQGMMSFDSEPLENVIAEVSRYSKLKFVIADDDLRRIPVTGYFKLGDTDALVDALRANFDIRAERVGSSVILRSHSR